MTLTIDSFEEEQIRKVLNGIGITTLGDETITLQLGIAFDYINANMITGATDAKIKPAVIYWASYMSAISYITQVTREMGRLPQGVDIAIDNLKDIAFGFLRAVLQDDDAVLGEPKKEDRIGISSAIMTRTYDSIYINPGA